MKTIFKQPVYKRIFNTGDSGYGYNDEFVEENVLLEINFDSNYSEGEEVYIENKRYTIFKKLKTISNKEEAMVYIIDRKIIYDGKNTINTLRDKNDKIHNLKREKDLLEFKINELKNHWLVKLFKLSK